MKSLSSLSLVLAALACQGAWAQSQAVNTAKDAPAAAQAEQKAGEVLASTSTAGQAVEAAGLVAPTGLFFGPIGAVAAFVTAGAVLVNNTGSTNATNTSPQPTR